MPHTPHVPHASQAHLSGGPPTHVPEPRDAAAGPDTSPGKVSVSVAATSVPTANGRGRKLSCTVALAVAGALAAVVLGGVFVGDLLPGGDNDSDSGSDAGPAPTRPAATPSASAPSASGTDGSDLSAVPSSYLGTWEGDGFALDGKLPMGTFRVTVRQAEVGDQLGTFRQTDLIGGTCDTDLILKKVTPKQLIATSISKPSTTSECTTGRHEVRLIPLGDDLRYETDNADAGDPVARMSKVE